MQYVHTPQTKDEIAPLWGAVWAMSLCAMVLVASEFMPVSLLTPIAFDLHMSEGQAGQSIAISGFFALITSLWLTSFIGNRDRRHVLLFFTVLMGLSGIIVSFAPSAMILMIGRALLGVCIGGFWSMSAATIMRLVPKKSVPKALAVLNGGNALSTTIAAPLGSFLGGMIGWRGAFFCIVPLAFIAFMWLYKSVPTLPSLRPSKHRATIGNVFKLLTQWKVALGMVSTMLFFMGQFALFTYLRPFLEKSAGVNVEMLSLILLAMGVSGLLGTFVIGAVLKTRLYSVLISIPFVMMLIAISLTFVSSSLIAIVLLLSVWGFLGTAAPVVWWTWLAHTLPNEAEIGGGLMVAVIQLAITLGAAVGGLYFDSYGYGRTFFFSASLLGLATIMASVTAFMTRQS